MHRQGTAGAAGAEGADAAARAVTSPDGRCVRAEEEECLAAGVRPQAFIIVGAVEYT